MSETDIKNTLEQMWRAGFERGYAMGREGATGDQPPDVRIEWRGRQPVFHIERPKITLGHIGLIKPPGFRS